MVLLKMLVSDIQRSRIEKYQMFLLQRAKGNYKENKERKGLLGPYRLRKLDP
jgi:hypothetical protein